jgi:hypothetical protein
MEGIVQASEKPPAQKQWETMEKTMRRAIGTVGKSSRVLTSGWTPEDRRRRCAPVATVRHPRDDMKKPADEQWRATVARMRD